MGAILERLVWIYIWTGFVISRCDAGSVFISMPVTLLISSPWLTATVMGTTTVTPTTTSLTTSETTSETTSIPTSRTTTAITTLTETTQLASPSTHTRVTTTSKSTTAPTSMETATQLTTTELTSTAPTTDSTTLTTTTAETTTTASIIPAVYSLFPGHGPLAGGTNITLHGTDMKQSDPVTAVVIGKNSQATVRYLNDSYMEAETGVGLDTDMGRMLGIRLRLASGRLIPVAANVTFTYRLNPNISDIFPLITIVEGGVFLTVVGSSLDSVFSPVLELTTNIRRYAAAGSNVISSETNSLTSEVCEHVANSSGTRLLCPTPPSDIPGDIRASVNQLPSQPDPRAPNETYGLSYDTDLAVVTLYIGFKFDGYLAYTNISNVTDEALARKGVLEIVVTPFFNVTLEAAYDEGTPLNIPGYFVDAIDHSNYVVDVGAGVCQMVEISSKLLICWPPSRDDINVSRDRDVNYAVTVRPGKKLAYNVGQITYRTDLFLIIGVSIGGAVLLLGVTVVTVILVRRHRARKRTRNDHMAKMRDPDAEIRLGELPDLRRHRAHMANMNDPDAEISLGELPDLEDHRGPPGTGHAHPRPDSMLQAFEMANNPGGKHPHPHLPGQERYLQTHFPGQDGYLQTHFPGQDGYLHPQLPGQDGYLHPHLPHQDGYLETFTSWDDGSSHVAPVHGPAHNKHQFDVLRHRLSDFSRRGQRPVSVTRPNREFEDSRDPNGGRQRGHSPDAVSRRLPRHPEGYIAPVKYRPGSIVDDFAETGRLNRRSHLYGGTAGVR